MKTLSKYLLFGAVAAGLWSCSSEESVEELQTSGRTVQLTVNVSREGDNAATRTEMSEANGGADLGCVWTSGDKLLVTDAQGNACGVLTLSSGDQKVEGTFSGEVTVSDNPAVSLNFIYLGTDWSDAADPADNSTWNASNGSVSLDYSTQDGSLASLTKNDLLVQTAEVAVNGKEATSEETINMDRLISFAKFSLDNLGETVKGEDLGDITVSGTGLVKACSLNLSNLSVTTTTGDITISTDNPSKDFYMVLVPGAQSAFDINVKVSDGKDVYAGSYKATKKLEKGLYYRKQIAGADGAEDSYAGLPVDNWSSTPNPGNMDNWGLPKSSPEYTDSQLRQPTKDSSAVGWVFNQRLGWITNCWFDPFTFTKNGGIEGYLYSTVREEPSYYQWGRWLGFPIEIGCSPILDRSGYVINDWAWTSNSYPICINKDWDPTQSRFGYTCSNIVPMYTRIYNTTWSSWNEELSKNAASVWGIDDTSQSIAYDYIVGGYRKDTKWENRSGNPCPNKYRIPSKEELAYLIPSEVGFSEHAEVKNIYGKLFAVSYKVDYTSVNEEMFEVANHVSEIYGLKNNFIEGNIPVLIITSVPIDANIPNINYENEIFKSDEATKLKIGAYGVLARGGAINFLGSKAVIWSNESQIYGENSSGYGAVVLEISFKNGMIEDFKLKTRHRAEGANVIPFHDKNAKGSTLKPYWPYCMIGLE